jgi:hypothetical protein
LGFLRHPEIFESSKLLREWAPLTFGARLFGRRWSTKADFRS